MIAFAFTFPAGRYHATPWGRHANEADVAWPPEPVRILRALIATWARKADPGRFPLDQLRDMIDALAAEPPVFRLPAAVHTHICVYMPAPTTKSLIYDGFLRFDRDAELIVAWPGGALTKEQTELAQHLLERIGYLGRAESWVEGRLADDWDGEGINARPRVPGMAAPPDTVPVDVATPLTPSAWTDQRQQLAAESAGMAKAKRALFDATLPERLADALSVDTGQWQAAGWSSPPPLRKIVYDRPVVGPLPPRRDHRTRVLTGLPNRPEVARFVLAGRPCPRVEETLRIAEIARWALIRRQDGVETPPELLGRDGDGPLRDDPAHAHAFYLPEDADGDGLIDHLVVSCRHGFSQEARRRLDRLTHLWLAHGRADAEGERGRKEWRVALEDIATLESFASSPLLGAARVWVSATPCLRPRFDRHPPSSFDALVETYRVQIIGEWQRRFPGRPVPQVEPITDPDRQTRFAAPLGQGGQRRSPLDFVRTRAGRGGQQPDAAGGFFRLIFAQPESGPIALGWGAHFGLGLFRRED